MSSTTASEGTAMQARATVDRPSDRELVVERTIRRYDPTGRGAVSEKVRIEERKDAAGNTIVNTAVYDADINGRFALRERVKAQSTKSGDTMHTQTVVERPNLNGSLDTVERREAVQMGTDKNLTVDVSVFRRDANGAFSQTERQTVQTVVSGDLAYQRGTFTVEATPKAGGNKTRTSGTFLRIYRRQPDGSWRMTRDMFNSDQPPNRNTSPAPAQ